MTIQPDDPRIERVARALCEFDGYGPDDLEAGTYQMPWEDDDPTGVRYDRLSQDGQPLSFIWRQFVGQALAALSALDQ